MDTQAEIERLSTEIARLKENYEFLIHYYRVRISEKQEELDNLRRTKRRINAH